MLWHRHPIKSWWSLFTLCFKRIHFFIMRNLRFIKGDASWMDSFFPPLQSYERSDEYKEVSELANPNLGRSQFPCDFELVWIFYSLSKWWFNYSLYRHTRINYVDYFRLESLSWCEHAVWYPLNTFVLLYFDWASTYEWYMTWYVVKNGPQETHLAMRLDNVLIT